MKLASKLPKGDANGLAALTPAMVRDPHRMHVILAVVDCSQISTNVDDGSVEPTARLRRVETILDDDRGTAEQLIRRALERRLGGTVLPLDVEDELNAIFESFDVDPDTGEIRDGGESA